MEDEMGTAQMCDTGCVTDGKLITGRAAGSAFDFGLALISALRGEERARQVAAEVVYP
jgi:4-methyl-5(b-hydroxyethyl)-thiazole monophosphate biosynthesis